MRHIVIQVCAALAEVHGKGMIHRDIKPENVMVCERGGEFDFVKVLDFGIVKRIEVAPDAHPNEARVLTRQVRLLGTPGYMPPERIGAPSGVDARADIYGVGAIIFFLVAGRPLFEGSDEASLLRQVLADPVPRLADLVRGIPAPLDDLVARCLAKAPAERPGAVGDIVAVLESLRLPPWTRDDARNWWELWRESTRADATRDDDA
jgi:serine/threonine-protein kinase